MDHYGLMDTETGAIADRSAFKKQMTGLTFLTGEEKSTAELLMDDCLERSQSVEIDIKGLRAYQALHCVRPSIVKALKQKGCPEPEEEDDKRQP